MTTPPVFCPEHPNGAHGMCPACSAARRRYEAWVVHTFGAPTFQPEHPDFQGMLGRPIADRVTIHPSAHSDIMRSLEQHRRNARRYLEVLDAARSALLAELADGERKLLDRQREAFEGPVSVGIGIGVLDSASIGSDDRLLAGDDRGDFREACSLGSEVGDGLRHGSPLVDVPAAATAGDSESIVGAASAAGSPAAPDATPLETVLRRLDRIIELLAPSIVESIAVASADEVYR